jgi:hypothetical protein
MRRHILEDGNSRLKSQVKESLGFIKVEEFLEQLRCCQLLVMLWHMVA